jgi:hypothetical protein
MSQEQDKIKDSSITEPTKWKFLQYLSTKHKSVMIKGFDAEAAM